MRLAPILLVLAAPSSAAQLELGTDVSVSFARWAPHEVAEGESGAAVVGETLVVALEVEHPAGAAIQLSVDPERPLFEHPWLLLEELPLEKRKLAAPRAQEADGESVRSIDSMTRYRWRVTRLAPGAGYLPTLDLLVGNEFITASSQPVSFASALGDEENRPRPPAPFHEPEFEAAAPLLGPLARALLYAAAGLVALILGVRLLSKRKRALASAPPEPSVLLSALEDDLAAGGDAARRAHFELTRILRAAVDERVGQARAAATDAEWLAALRTESAVDAATLDHCAQVLERAGDVKYAGRDVTRWAAEETLASARAVLEPGASGADPKDRRGSAA